MSAATVSRPDMHMTSGDYDGGCFDCNICLEPACDPVVTTCGHLYCWPCICRWSRAQNGGDRSVAAQQDDDGRKIACPVCRNSVDMNRSLIPLYGRGSSSRLSSSHGDGMGHDIPLRPSRTQPSQVADPADADTCFDPAAGIGRMNNRRARREELKLEKSLNRVSVFLLCCAVMCLLAF